MTEPKTIQLENFLKHFDGVPSDADICFQDGLEFKRLKQRGPNLFQIEFNPQETTAPPLRRRSARPRVIGHLAM